MWHPAFNPLSLTPALNPDSLHGLPPPQAGAVLPGRGYANDWPAQLWEK
jgi:hypothetical protein